MNIEEGLKKIIKTNGREILGTPICYNILADFGVFKNSPGYKNIFRGIIECGYMTKMLSLTKWDDIIIQWSLNFSIHKGFNKEWTKDIFLLIAHSLELNQYLENCDNIGSMIEFDYVPKTPSSTYEEYFNSITNLSDIVKEGQEIGLTITKFQLKVRQYAWQFDSKVPYGYIDVSLELNRIQKLKRIRKLWIALYAKDDSIIKKFSVGEMRNDDSHFKPCISSTGVELDKVARIVLFWG